MLQLTVDGPAVIVLTADAVLMVAVIAQATTKVLTTLSLVL